MGILSSQNGAYSLQSSVSLSVRPSAAERGDVGEAEGAIVRLGSHVCDPLPGGESKPVTVSCSTFDVTLNFEGLTRK